MNIELEVELVFRGRAPKSYLVRKKLPVTIKHTRNSIEIWPVDDKLTWTNKPSIKEMIDYSLFNPVSRLLSVNFYYDKTLLGVKDLSQRYATAHLLDDDFSLQWDGDPIIRINTSALTFGGLKLLLDTIENNNVN